MESDSDGDCDSEGEEGGGTEDDGEGPAPSPRVCAPVQSATIIHTAEADKEYKRQLAVLKQGPGAADAGNGRVSEFRVADGSFLRHLATGLSFLYDVEECDGGWMVACGSSHTIELVASTVVLAWGRQSWAGRVVCLGSSLSRPRWPWCLAWAFSCVRSGTRAGCKPSIEVYAHAARHVYQIINTHLCNRKLSSNHPHSHTLTIFPYSAVFLPLCPPNATDPFQRAHQVDVSSHFERAVHFSSSCRTRQQTRYSSHTHILRREALQGTAHT